MLFRSKEVNIYRYVTENTFDAYLWQTIENKQKQFQPGDLEEADPGSCADEQVDIGTLVLPTGGDRAEDPHSRTAHRRDLRDHLVVMIAQAPGQRRRPAEAQKTGDLQLGAPRPTEYLDF